MLLPAFGLPYAVAVKHVFSPRTVLRRSLQYALAQRTLTVLTVLPAVPLVLSLVRQRDLSLTQIVTGRPLFYAVGHRRCWSLARRYREPAERWLDRRFFRAEYDAREILMSLAGRLPFESDPSELVALVIHHVDSALHPESVAVLAEVAPGRFETVGARPAGAAAAAGRWRPADAAALVARAARGVPRRRALERGAAARRGPRAGWPRPASHLLVPLLAGNTAEPTLVGVLALGPKQSDEPYAPEDRCAALGHRRADGGGPRRVARPPARARAARRAAGHGADPGRGRADARRLPALSARASELARAACPDDGAALVPVPGLPPVVDGKYRVDAQIGRGGMGAVFSARDVRLDRDVAIKVVRADLLGSPDARVALPARGPGRGPPAASGGRGGVRLRHASPTAPPTS